MRKWISSNSLMTSNSRVPKLMGSSLMVNSKSNFKEKTTKSNSTKSNSSTKTRVKSSSNRETNRKENSSSKGMKANK